MSPLFFTFDNKKLYAASNIGRDKSEIVIFDPETGKETESLFANEQVDVGNLSYSKKRKVITKAYYTTDKVHYKFFDDESEAMYKRVKKELPDYDCYFTSTNTNEDKYLIRTYSDRSLGAYYFYDYVTDELSLIGEVSPWMNEEQMAPMKPIQYTSRDGLTIYGYLTLPVGVEAKNLPLVVNPHGGPWARDQWGFNPEIQFLANRGYAVLQMNFRGSTGYGREFWEISFKQWGQTMQDDITDAVKWAISEGIADKDRVAIYGGSYGGYATLAGLAFTPDLYRCGVDYVGVSNMFTFMNTIPPYWEPYRQMFYEMAGDPVKDSVMLAKVSPALHADKIVAPLFVAQGANDPRVNLAESDQMVEAMKLRGVDVEYLVKNNEGHGFRNQENRFDFYRAMEMFLETHMMKEKEE
jgi:dipeptidyl aminopeptidase/acylaminoacyl peptidase